MVEAQKRTANEMAAVRTDLASQRTLMAADRTLMAWIRTALSMISFGFTIYKLLQGFEASGGTLPGESSPRSIGLFLTGLGTVAMVMGLIEYRTTVKTLRAIEAVRFFRPTLVMAVIMTIMGLFLFFSIIARLL